MAFELVVFAAFAAIVCGGGRIVRESERLLVLRLGRPFAVLRPGLRWIIPGIDRTVRVDLARGAPGWARLSSDELDRKLLHLAESGQLPTTFEV